MLFPEGPEGPAGKSAYEVWVDAVNDGTVDWPKDRTDENNFFLFLKGKDGEDGKSAYEIWITEVEAGLDNPKNPGTDWPKDETDLNDFWYYLTGADGKDGVTPNIGDNGHWWVNGEDTGIAAQGPQGEPGEDGEDGADGSDGSNSMPDITIGENGNWYINGVDTGKPSRGPQGEQGESGGSGSGTQGPTGPQGPAGPAGQSAYDLWKEEVGKGNVYKNGEQWPSDRISVNDFWEFLRGNDGEDGKDGQDGDDALNAVEIIKGYPNVIIQYYKLDSKEYVSWEDGSVKYRIYNKEGKVAPQSKVKLPGIDNKEYTADKDGYITVSKAELPDKYFGPTAQAEVDIAGDEEEYVKSAENTIVPAEMLVQMILDPNNLPKPSVDKVYGNPCVNVWFLVQRKVRDDKGVGEWENIPADLGDTKRIIEIYQKNGEEEETLLNETDNKIDVAVTTSNNCMVQIRRGFVYTEMNGLDKSKVEGAQEDKNKGYYYWGAYDSDKKYYSRLGVKSCYGEDLMLQGWVEMLPAQFAPTINTIERSEIYNSQFDNHQLIDVKGTFDIEHINWDLCLETNISYSKSNSQINNADVYVPEKVTKDDLGDATPFLIKFTEATGSMSNISSAGGTLETPTFTASNVRINSQVSADVHTSGQHAGVLSANFYEIPLGTISSSQGQVVLRLNGNYVTSGTEIEIKISEELKKD